MITWLKKQIKINTLENNIKTLEKENIELLRKLTFKDDEIELLKEQIIKLKENKKKNIDSIEKLKYQLTLMVKDDEDNQTCIIRQGKEIEELKKKLEKK